MDVTQQIAIEVLFNTAGFLMAAGIFWLFTKRGRNTEALMASREYSQSIAAVNLNEETNPMIKSVQPEQTVSESQYLNLSSEDRPYKAVFRSKAEQDARSTTSRNHLNHRVDVMRKAKQMLNHGNSAAEIKRLLPLTDGELALLQSV